MTTVGIIGLGLIGGSLARDLAAAGWRVLGGDRDPAAVDAARRAGVAEALELDALRLRDSLESIDLLVLAVPVRAAPGWIRRLAPLIPPGSELVVTDVGSTKETVARAVAAADLDDRFVGSHPMAGDHRSGFGASRAGLFRDAPVWLCPGPHGTPRAVDRVRDVWEAVGAVPRIVDAAEHDRRLAHTSHLPQVVSTALAAALAGLGFTRDDLGPGGRDVTRLAGSDTEMWVDILLDNARHLEPALERAAAEILHIAALLQDGREDSLRQVLSAARIWGTAGEAGLAPEDTRA